MKVKIVVADDHRLIRKALAISLGEREDIEVCAEAANGSEALAAVSAHRPHILFLDLQMPGMDGFEVLQNLYSKNCDTKTIVLSGFDNEKNILRCFDLGASGFMDKMAPQGEEYVAVDSVMRIGLYAPPKISHLLLRETREFKTFKPFFEEEKVEFNATEMRVLHEHCLQYSDSEIAERIFMSDRTVESAKRTMKEKVKAINFTGVLMYCHQQRLIDLDFIPIRQK